MFIRLATDWRLIAIWATFQPVATIILAKSPTFQAFFVKVSKSFIFLVKSFLSNFYRHLMIIFWSHWSDCVCMQVPSYHILTWCVPKTSQEREKGHLLHFAVASRMYSYQLCACCEREKEGMCKSHTMMTQGRYLLQGPNYLFLRATQKTGINNFGSTKYKLQSIVHLFSIIFELKLLASSVTR